MPVYRSTIQHLRFPFSLFLMPVYWFALSSLEQINPPHAVLIFAILHLLVYPASNGFNSYMDKDTGPIGGVRKPLPATRQLLVAAGVLDLIAILLSLLISWTFTLGLLVYMLASRSYSARAIRLKKYAVVGYLTVILCQGALTFWLVYTGASANNSLQAPVVLMLASSLLIGGFYPLTQVYQHEQDRRDGVRTISMLLGKQGTFIFCGIVYTCALALLGWYWGSRQQWIRLEIVMAGMLPTLVYFLRWFLQVRKDSGSADFHHTMRMNWLASVCASVSFIILMLLGQDRFL